jgi:hypothetical protein
MPVARKGQQHSTPRRALACRLEPHQAATLRARGRSRYKPGQSLRSKTSSSSERPQARLILSTFARHLCRTASPRPNQAFWYSVSSCRRSAHLCHNYLHVSSRAMRSVHFHAFYQSNETKIEIENLQLIAAHSAPARSRLRAGLGRIARPYQLIKRSPDGLVDPRLAPRKRIKGRRRNFFTHSQAATHGRDGYRLSPVGRTLQGCMYAIDSRG